MWILLEGRYIFDVLVLFEEIRQIKYMIISTIVIQNYASNLRIGSSILIVIIWEILAGN